MDLHVRRTFDFFSFPFDLIMKNSIAREVQILTFLNGVKLLKIRKYYFSDFSVIFQPQSHILLFKELKRNSDMAAHVHKSNVNSIKLIIFDLSFNQPEFEQHKKITCQCEVKLYRPGKSSHLYIFNTKKQEVEL